MNKIFISFCFLILFSSCKILFKKAYHMGAHMNYKTKSAYISYLKRKHFPIDKIVFLDSVTYLKFAEFIAKDASNVYYGAFVNDSTQLKKSAYIYNNQSCSGRMNNEIDSILKLSVFPDLALVYNPVFIKYPLHYLNNNKLLQGIISNKKILICLFYSYTQGTYYNKLYREIFAAVKEHENWADLLIITLDNVSYIKN